jgi:histidine triad (HIT) family protein
MPCLFCEIVSGKLPSYKIFEDNDSVAFLDINPATPGHMLIIPKAHATAIFDIDELALRRLISSVKRVAEHVKKVLECDITVLQNNGRLAGQGVEHMHFHVIPQKLPNVVPFAHIGPRADDSDLAAMAEKLRF